MRANELALSMLRGTSLMPHGQKEIRIAVSDGQAVVRVDIGGNIDSTFRPIRSKEELTALILALHDSLSQQFPSSEIDKRILRIPLEQQTPLAVSSDRTQGR